MIPSNYVLQRGCHSVDWRTVEDARDKSAEEWLVRCEMAEAQIREPAYFILYWREFPWAEVDAIPETFTFQIGDQKLECRTGPEDHGCPEDGDDDPAVSVWIDCEEVRHLLDRPRGRPNPDDEEEEDENNEGDQKTCAVCGCHGPPDPKAWITVETRQGRVTLHREDDPCFEHIGERRGMILFDGDSGEVC